MPSRAVVFILAALLCAGSLAAQDQPVKYALLVGVTKYDHKDMNTGLKFPEADAQALGKVFADSGYTVDLLLGSKATQQAIRAKLAAFDSQGNSDGVVVIGLFGHGTEPVGTGLAYFCPYDTRLREVTDSQGRVVPGKNGQPQLQEVPESLIAMPELLKALRLSKAGNRVLLADCCRNDPTGARGRNAFGTQLLAQDIPNNTATLFACSKGEQAYEHNDWGHGAFTKCLLDEMQSLAATGKVRAATLSDNIQDKVEKLVESKGHDKQTPFAMVIGKVDLQLTPRLVPNPKLITSKSTGMKLTLIPAGTFQMGSSAAEVLAAVQADSNFKEEFAKDEQPPHSVHISQAFYMGVNEVTQGEYESVMGTNPSSFSKTGDGKNSVSGHDTSKFPVERVSWYDAIEFCNKLSVQDGLTPCYSLTNATRESGSIKSATVTPTAGNGYRLPTEAEWEYACRGGSTTVWHTGNTLASLNEVGWWGADATPAGNSEKRTNRVGQKAVNAFGLFDMHGNVWEWCFDVYDESVYGKRSGTTPDPIVTSGSDVRVLRGGSWYYYAWFTRSADRTMFTPDDRVSYFGFRVVCLGLRTP